MTRLDISRRGAKSFKQLSSARLQNRLEKLLELLQETPTIGSRLVRDSLKEEFGDGCLKMDLKPFLLLYDYDEESDIVHVYGLVHGHSVK